MNPVTQDEIAAFVARCQGVVDAYFAAHYENLTSDLLVFDMAAAKKYVRIVSQHRRTDNGVVTVTSQTGSAWAFINLENGDVLKPASWKTPAKHSRGNLRNPDGGMTHIGPYGPAYLR